jgi:dihydrofolate synthase/folylpolyglutamate synthase
MEAELGKTRHTSVTSAAAGHDSNGHVRWLQSLTPWPEEFGLARMHALLADLGEPQRRYPAIHVVGTNGKTSTALLTAELLRAAGLHVGAYISPHVRGWAERIQVDGRHADLEAALERIARNAEGATQFEVLTATALAEFAAREVDVAVVEAGLGGRHDATNVLHAPVVVLTNIALDHTQVLGETRDAIAAEKLAVVTPGAAVILGEPEWEALARANGAARVELAGGSNLALAVAAAEAHLGRPVDPHAADALEIPGRLEYRGHAPLEIWDGAHNLAGIGYLLPRLPDRRFTIVASILADKKADAMLRALTAVGDALVATRSGNPRALPAEELARVAAPHFSSVEAVPDPHEALKRARALAGSDGAVLVTGSLYLLSDLSGHR